MYKLLIVDDEPAITDWLYELFHENASLELDIYKACSGREAMALLSKTKFDIVLSDIRMPGIDGLQLMKKIKGLWPDCRIIFLTGFNEFDYVYTAIHHEGVDFLLKTEEDDKITEAVEKAIFDIEKGHKDEELICKANRQMSITLPLLQKEFLQELLDGSLPESELSQSRLDELGLPLRLDMPVILLIGLCDQSDATYSQKSKINYAVKMIAAQYFYSHFNEANIEFGHSYLVWLYQLKDLENGRDNAVNFIKETLESVQASCKASLNMTFSFITGSDYMEWKAIPDQYMFLKQLLDYRTGSGKEMILTEKSFFDIGAKQTTNPDLHKAIMNLKRRDDLVVYLERGQKSEFLTLLSEIIDGLRKIKSRNNITALEIYYSISLIYLSYINRWNLTERIACQTRLDLLVRSDEHQNWNDAVTYLYNLSEILFELRVDDQEKRTNDRIARVQQYISQHLNEDLSLTKLADISYSNPSYLSRLFKQVLGTTLSDYISGIRITRARELLETSNLKIHEIAGAVGYESAHYFARFFKRFTNLTPQEYREALLKINRTKSI